MLESACQLCKSKQWTLLNTIEFGTWNTSAVELERNTKSYPVCECQNCGHVQVAICYDDNLFSQLYFHSHQEGILWGESLVGDLRPYQEMVSFFSEYLVPDATLVDFGCGMGDLLLTAQSQQPKANLQLIGVDFNNRTNNENISYLSADLNDMDSLTSDLWLKGIDVACASHVLEHIIDPIDFLTNLAKQLNKNGKIFIEVPDFSSEHELDSIGLSNLINLQHIHYYTADSISQIAIQSGLDIVKIKQFTTSYIPRLQVILTKSSLSIKSNPKVKKTAVKSVLNYISQSQIKRHELAEKILQIINNNAQVGVWGIGADFYLLVTENPELNNAIKLHQVELFDYELKNHSYSQCTIRSSTEISTFIFPVFMTPLLAETRIKMHQASQLWPVKPVDFFNEIT